MSRSGPGPFIYTGSGKKQSEDASLSQKLCTKQACLIQWCLAKNNHQQSRCQDVIDNWKECVVEANKLEQEMKENNRWFHWASAAHLLSKKTKGMDHFFRIHGTVCVSVCNNVQFFKEKDMTVNQNYIFSYMCSRILLPHFHHFWDGHNAFALHNRNYADSESIRLRQ